MKVKILLMPLIIVIAVAISIWFVYPAYSNGIDGAKENYVKLKSEQTKLDELLEKRKNADSLSTQISSLPEKDILYAFVPAETREEEIVNSLVNLSAISGLLLFDETVDKPNQENQIVEELAPVSTSELGVPLPVAMPKIQNIKTEIKLVGSYEKIKEFLTNFGKFNRSNIFEILEISKSDSGDQLALNQDALLVSAMVNFNVLKKAKISSSNINSSVFDNPQLETKVISDIKNKKIANDFKLNIEQKGKNNIFQP